MKKHIYIIRHCQAEGQEANASLTERGYNQAVLLAEFLSNIKADRIISSPFLRALESIEPFAKSKSVDVQIDDRLAERVLSSLSMPDWLDKLNETFSNMELKLKGGESSVEAQKRILEVINEILTSDLENTIIVTHGNIMSLLLKYYDNNFGFELWKSLRNPDVFLLQFTNNTCSIERVWEK
ncbi:histidine phosphatase family protein [Psychrobacillus sp. NPDC058041]|uniref:histidine phosphatase family protein n=1 Tax=Psychrobacillus sp. NPDC058041 TaxID=3346310 RepID=UPI0036DDF14E